MSAPGEAMSAAEVRKIARLARLALSDAQVERYVGQLGHVLGYVERLRGLNLEGVQPLTNPGDLTNRLDDDEPSAPAPAPGSERLPREALMRMAPAAHPPFVRVPRVMGDDGGA